MSPPEATEPLNIVLALLPWLCIAVFLYFMLFRGRRTYWGADRRGRLPAVINPDGSVPVTTIVAQQAAPAYEARRHDGSAGLEPFLTVTVFLPTAVDFMASRRSERRQQSLMLRASTVRVASGDEAFDRSLEVSGSDSKLLAAMLGSPAVRAALEDLFARGVSLLRADGKALDATWLNCPPGNSPDSEMLTGTVKNLQKLAEAIESHAPPPEPIITNSAAAATMLLAVAPILVSMGLSLSWRGAALVRPPWYIPAAYVAVGLPAMLVLAVLLDAIIRRRAQSRRARGMVVMAALISSYFFGDFAFRLLNAQLDRGEASMHIQRVVGWRGGRSEDFIEVLPWDGTERCVSIPVSFRDLERVKSYDAAGRGPLRAEIVTRPGRLHCAWVESFRLLGPED